MSRPEIIPYKDKWDQNALLDVKGMIHPCVSLDSGKAFIPNDTRIEPNGIDK